MNFSGKIVRGLASQMSALNVSLILANTNNKNRLVGD